jgi:spore maturation protein CgeB
MKVLIVGSDEKWALENEYVWQLERICKVEFFNAHGLFLEHYQKNKINKTLFRLGFSTILDKINKELLVQIEELKPEVVFVFKGMEIFPKTLELIRSMGIFLVNYNGDHPYKFTTKGSGNKNVKNSIRLYDLHFTYSLEIKNQLQNKFKVNSEWLPFGYYKAVKPHLDFTLIDDLCFIGHPDKERVRIINLILGAGHRVSVYGINWGYYTFSNSELLTINKSIFRDDFNSEAIKYKIQLNVFRSHNYNSHNMRTFEMPALGCIMLAPYSAEHLAFFKENKEAFFYKNDTDLLTKIEQIQNMSSTQISNIRSNAYNRSIESGYSYEKRAMDVLNKIIEVKNKSSHSN